MGSKSFCCLGELWFRVILVGSKRMYTFPEVATSVLNVKPEEAFQGVSRVGRNVVDYSKTALSLSPESQKIADLIIQAPSLIEMLPQTARDLRTATGNPFDYEEVEEVEKADIKVPGADSILEARIYKTKGNQNKKNGALIYYHGGGFVLSDIELYDGLTSQLAFQSGLVVISVNYRLAPETPFPGGLLDTQASFNWLYEHAEEFGMDAERMAIGGDSSGANLAAVTCILNRDQDKPMPAMQMLIYPSTMGNTLTESRKRLHDAPVIPQPVIEWFHNHYISAEFSSDPRFDIMATKDLSRLPPAFVLTAGYDPLIDEGEAFANRLRENGVPVRYSCYADTFHGFYNFGVLPQARAAVTESAAILSAVLAR